MTSLRNGEYSENRSRFEVVRDYFYDQDDTWYVMRAEENHLLFGTSGGKRTSKKQKHNERRYFNCYYDSFTEREDRFYIDLQKEVILTELNERRRIGEYEEEEFCGICRCAGETLGVPQWRRMRYISLPPLEAEEMNRRIIVSDYFSMLLEAAVLLEVLHRRTVTFAEEPPARSVIEGAEVHDWLESRRRILARESQEEMAEQEQERQMRLAFFAWKQKQEYQIFLFEQSEREERLDVERLQRLHAGTLAELFNKEHREARYHQLKYQLRQRSLPAELSRELTARETTERSSIMLMQRDYFRTLQADEVKSFLWTRRNMMINEQVELERFSVK